MKSDSIEDKILLRGYDVLKSEGVDVGDFEYFKTAVNSDDGFFDKKNSVVHQSPLIGPRYWKWDDGKSEQ